jgi:hypothetical protein
LIYFSGLGIMYQKNLATLAVVIQKVKEAGESLE